MIEVIDVHVVEIRQHPDQATINPGCWAVKLQVSYDGSTRTFWRWYLVRVRKDGRYVLRSNDEKELTADEILAWNAKKPTVDEILAWFWDDTFAELHGFSFNKDDP